MPNSGSASVRERLRRQRLAPQQSSDDNRGNLNYRNGVSLSFDQKNQLSWISGSDSYSYDAFGHRVMKQAADGTANYKSIR